MSSLAAVPKPSTAGQGQTAIADTRLSFANIRNGPGEQYADIGDLRDNSLCIFYPNSRTSTGWVWVEISGAAGWVSTSVVSFEPVVVGQRLARPLPRMMARQRFGTGRVQAFRSALSRSLSPTSSAAHPMCGKSG